MMRTASFNLLGKRRPMDLVLVDPLKLPFLFLKTQMVVFRR